VPPSLFAQPFFPCRDILDCFLLVWNVFFSTPLRCTREPGEIMGSKRDPDGLSIIQCRAKDNLPRLISQPFRKGDEDRSARFGKLWFDLFSSKRYTGNEKRSRKDAYL
jgi:hypothetical protein